MLSTMINALAAESVCAEAGLDAVTMSAVEMNKVAEYYTASKAKSYLDEGKIVIIGGGTGNPYFTTDTATILRALELEADIAFFAKNTDAVYSDDPDIEKRKYKDRPLVRYSYLTPEQIIKDELKAIDLSAVYMADEYNMKFALFAMSEPMNIIAAANGENPGTTVEKIKRSDIE